MHTQQDRNKLYSTGKACPAGARAEHSEEPRGRARGTLRHETLCRSILERSDALIERRVGAQRLADAIKESAGGQLVPRLGLRVSVGSSADHRKGEILGRLGLAQVGRPVR